MADKIERTEKKKRKWDVVGTEPVPVVDLQNPLIKDAARRIEQVAARINSYKLKEGTLMEFTKDIEINDLRARYLLTKQSFQHQLKIDTGAHVVTKGKYYPDIHLATEKDPPMYLHIEAPSKKSMDDAVNQIDHIIDHPNLPVHDGSLGALMGPSGRVPIGILHADALNLKAKIMGPSGTYVKHIQLETNCRLHLRGKGSGFIESTGQESREDMYMFISYLYLIQRQQRQGSQPCQETM